MAIFNSYVSLPEGNMYFPYISQISHQNYSSFSGSFLGPKRRCSDRREAL